MAQAMNRQRKNPGTTFAGTMLQHLVGATLELSLPQSTIQHNGASVADAVSSRSGDFVIDGIIIHCTVAPGDALLTKCTENLKNGLLPIILTIGKGVLAAQNLAESHGVDGRVTVWDAFQFVSEKIYLHSLFKSSNLRSSALKVFAKYNEIIEQHEANPSLKISYD